jgi:hypothetical protein
MQTIYMSNRGDDKNDGLKSESPVRSWKRAKELCKDNSELLLLEGPDTLIRLKQEIDKPDE